MKKKDKVFIAGGNTMVMEALFARLKKEGFTNLFVMPQAQLNLLDQRAVRAFFKSEKPEYCFLAPLKESGIEANIAYPADLIYENLTIQTNFIHSAFESGVKRLLFYAGSCSYPKNSPQPIKEKCLLNGPLEPTNEAYAVAKISGIKMCQAYNKQYGTRFICAIPATVYGPNDNFDFKTAHVVSALIRKFHKAKVNNEPRVTIWGTGNPKREFIYVDDLVDASLFLMKQNIFFDLVNIGSGIELTIKELAKRIKEVVSFQGGVEFDTNKPDGVARKLLDSSFLRSLGWRAKIKIDSGLDKTYSWYQKKLET